MSAATYVIAVTCTGLADSLIDRERQDSPSLKLILVLLGVVCCIPVGRAILAVFAPAGGSTLPPVSFVEVLRWTAPCLFVWMLANARDPRFQVDPQAAVGGNPMRPI